MITCKKFINTYELTLLLICYLLAFSIYRWGFGLFPDITAIDYLSQYLAGDWLKNDLLQSLWYLHAQPPLMGGIIGIALNVAPERIEIFISIFYLLLSLGAIVFIYYTLLRLHIGLLVRILTLFPLCVLPTYHLYGTWFYTTHIEFFLVAAGLYYFSAIVTHHHVAGSLIKFSIICLLLGLLRPQWHLVILLSFSVGFLFIKNLNKKQIMCASIIYLIPLAALYGKNLSLYNFFGASSWMGANLSQTTSPLLSEDEVKELVAMNAIAQDYPGGFYHKERLLKRFRGLTPSHYDHVSLQSLSKPNYFADYRYQDSLPINFNAYPMIASAKMDMHDALVVMYKYPLRYLKSVFARLIVYGILTPSIAYDSPTFRVAVIEDDVWLGRLGVQPSWLQALWIFSALGMYGILPIVMARICFSRKQKMTIGYSQRIFVIGVLYLIAIILITGSCLNGGEQERMRWSIMPAYLFLFAIMTDYLYRTHHHSARSCLYNIRKYFRKPA